LFRAYDFGLDMMYDCNSNRSTVLPARAAYFWLI